MTESPRSAEDAPGDPVSVHQLLLLLNLAMEVLEGLNELGLETRAEVEKLLADLERQNSHSS